MFGGISARGRVLVLADAAGAGEVYVFDLDERRVASRFSFTGLDGGYADVGGIALAEDSSLFVPDTRGCCVRRFSLFGNEVGVIGRVPGAVLRDRRGLVAHPRAVCIDSAEQLWVSCGDRPWVHGLQVFDKSGRFVRSVHAFGQREKAFGPALGLCAHGGFVWVADTGNDVVQCFREDGGFVSAHQLPDDHARPLAVAAWAGGRAVLVAEPLPRVLLVDRDYRPVGHLSVPTDAPLAGASDICCLSERDLFVLDRDGDRVLSFDLAGGFEEVLFDTREWQ